MSKLDAEAFGLLAQYYALTLAGRDASAVLRRLADLKRQAQGS